MKLSPRFIAQLAGLAGIFAALIMIAGSRDAQVIAGLLLVAAVLLSLPTIPRWARQVRRGAELRILSVVEHRARDLQAKRRAETLPGPNRPDSPLEVPE